MIFKLKKLNNVINNQFLKKIKQQGSQKNKTKKNSEKQT